MAYELDSTLAADIRASAEALGAAACWPSGEPLSVSNSFLFELYVLFQIAVCLSKNHVIEYLEGHGDNANKFPRGAPANKLGRPRFDIKSRPTMEVLFQLCAGTKAADMNGDRRGLDISFQTADASDDPDVDDVVQIMDAKHRDDGESRIGHPEFAAFAHWVEVFELRNATGIPIDFDVLADLNANCLITNGNFSTEELAECVRVNVREVADFYPTKDPYRVRPQP